MSSPRDRFEAATLPHIDAAYNLARWLLHDGDRAEDIVQEAYLRAFRYFESLRENDAKPWLLGIVRNCCFTWLKEQKQLGVQVEFDEEWDAAADDESSRWTAASNPERALMHKQDVERIDKAIEELPAIFREVVILRELEDLSYEQMAEIITVPIGTVMSRLARARAMLREKLAPVMRRAAR